LFTLSYFGGVSPRVLNAGSGYRDSNSNHHLGYSDIRNYNPRPGDFIISALVPVDHSSLIRVNNWAALPQLKPLVPDYY
jgi:hypothetical protein